MKMLTRNFLQLMTASALIFLSACEKDDPTNTQVTKKDATAKEVMEQEANYSHMNEAVEESEQSDFFASANANITVFVATNQAFEDLFAETGVSSMSELEAQMGEDAFARMVMYHALNGRFSFNELTDGNRETYAESDGGARLTVLVENDNQARLLINGNDEAGASTTSSNTIEATNGNLIEVNGVIHAQSNFENIEEAESQNESNLFVEIMTNAEASTQAMLKDEANESTVLVAQDADVENTLSIYLASILDVDDLANLLDAGAQGDLFAQYSVSTLADLMGKVSLNDLLTAASITTADVMAELEAEDRTEFMSHLVFSSDLDLESMPSGGSVTSEAGVKYDVTSNTTGNLVLTDDNGNEIVLDGQTAQSINGSLYLISEVK